MQFLKKYREVFEAYLETNRFDKEPQNLYDPINYILSIGGKRIRPLLLLMASDLLGGDVKKALHAAMSVEVFHNFTLLHDDIMDEAPLRRGEPTVHTKYDTNTAILSGDAMMIYAYNYLGQYGPDLSYKLLRIFNKMAIEVCEGQQMDMDFEERENVSVMEYIKMITYKTSVLIGAALEMGALIAGMDDKSAKHLYNFGVNIGVAFQMQDDVLDTFGDGKVGKQPGGDIIQNKKTYLYIKALELGDEEEQKTLRLLYAGEPSDPTEKVEKVRSIMRNTHVLVHSEQTQLSYRDLAFSHLEAITMSAESKDQFKKFGEFLFSRSV